MKVCVKVYNAMKMCVTVYNAMKQQVLRMLRTRLPSVSICSVLIAMETSSKHHNGILPDPHITP